MSTVKHNAEPAAQPSKLRAYAQLVRLPNVFTALADVLMGALVVGGDRQPAVVALLAASSALLYSAGMVLNDVFDFEIDARERPQRPLPSGRIELDWARRSGFMLLTLGTAMGVMASGLLANPRSAMLAVGIAAAVLAYDRVLKHTPLGPLGMGLCRFLNVLLGLSAAATPWHTYHLLLAGAIGVYIVGVTWFARTEAETSNRWQLALATLVMTLGIAGVVLYPRWVEDQELLAPLMREEPHTWYLVCALLGGSILWRCLYAIGDPQPQFVQSAIKKCILSLIMLDAVACFAIRGAPPAICVAMLLVPATLLGRRIYST